MAGNNKERNRIDNSSEVFDVRFKKILGIFIILVGIICLLPFLLTIESFHKGFDFSEQGEIGDTLGGTMGPFIAITASFLTFLAFWIQYKSNEQQKKQFATQADDIKVERFENKFYELLKIHRDNVYEMEIAGFGSRDYSIKGRNVFQEMFFEFRCIYHLSQTLNKEGNSEIKPSNYENIDMIRIAYHIFFLGVGNILAIKDSLDIYDQNFINHLINYLRNRFDNINPQFQFIMEKEGHKTQITYERRINILEGRSSILGHYYRHLFQMVNFIENQQNENLFSTEAKESYAKTLRAQLSNFEQLLLFYNVNTTFGQSWIKPVNLIGKYRLIKNIPLPETFGINPRTIFKEENVKWLSKGKFFFEWNEKHH